MAEPIPIAAGQWDSENCRGPWWADASCLESPYISNCDTSVYLENWHIDPRYLSSDRNRHALPTGSMLVLLRKELETLFHETTAQNVRIFPGDFTTEWREHVLRSLWTISRMPHLRIYKGTSINTLLCMLSTAHRSLWKKMA